MIFGKVVTAMITPFNKDGTVNYTEAVKIANDLAANGSDTVLLAGTTGESPTLTNEEELILFKKVKEGLAGRAKVLAGTGSNSTATAIIMTQKAEEIGIDGALIVVPYYNKPSQEGLYQHFKAIAEATSLPLMIYNIPGRTSRNMEPETVIRLSALEGYTAIKEASGDIEQMKKIIEQKPADFLLYSGDDALTFEVLKIGGVGVVSVAAHLVGLKIREMIEIFPTDQKKAEDINNELQELFKGLFITTNPAPVKEALNLVGYNCGIPRLPLVSLNSTEKEKLKTILKKYKLIK